MIKYIDFWKQHTKFKKASLLGLVIASTVQVGVLQLLVTGLSATTNTGLAVRGITLIVLPFLATFFASRMAAYTVNQLQLSLLENLSLASTNELERTAIYNFSKVITVDIDHLYHFWRELFSNAGFNMPALLYLSVVLLFKSQLGYIAILVCSITALWAGAYFINKQVRVKNSAHHLAFVDLQNKVQNYIVNIFQFRLYQSETKYLHILRKQLTEFSSMTASLSLDRHLFSTYISSFLLLLLWGALWLVQSEESLSPTLLAVLTLLFLEVRRIGNELFTAFFTYQKAQESAGRISGWLAESAPSTMPGPSLPNVPIRTEAMTFRYKDNQQAIQYPPMSISVGDKIWIKGPNGRGKSTFWKILTGLYSDTNTPLWLNGSAVRGNGLTPFFAKIAAVTEPPRSYSGTLWEIIGNFTLSRQEVSQWLADKKLLNSFQGYKDGLDTYYESAIGGLSAGQLKWLILVQAFCQEPEILVLDEPFSSLDTYHRTMALRLIEKLPPSTTLLVISHQDISLEFDKTIIL